jgi:flagellar biosynthesis/type III secretory pathway M-ring protein FliF/YscJ
MPVLQELGENAQKVYREMSVTQRLSIAMTGITVLLALGMVALVGWMSEDRGLVPLPIRVPAAQYDELKQLLIEAGMNPTYDRTDQTVNVPVDQHREAYMLLASNDMLDDASAQGFEEMLAKIDYTVNESTRQDMMMVAKQNELARMIGTMHQVESAKVVFAGGDRKRLGPPIPPRASVMVTTRLGQKVNQSVADTIIALVAGSMSGLQKQKVVVTDEAGQHFYARSDDDPSILARDRIKQQRAVESDYRQKVEELVRSYYPGSEVFAFVNAVLDLDSKSTETREILEGQPLRIIEEKEEQESTETEGAPVGTQPNVARQVNTGGGGRVHSTYSRKFGDQTNENGSRVTSTRKTTGKVEDLSVSLVMHLEPEVKRDPETGQPERDEQGNIVREAAAMLTEDQVLDLKRKVAGGLGILDRWQDVEVKQVQIPPYHLEVDEEDWAGMLAAFVKANITGIVLSGFVLVGLIMIWSQVRRVIPGEDLSDLESELAEEEPEEEVSDEERANAQFEQMRERVSEMVDEDPRKAASLVKRWLVNE